MSLTVVGGIYRERATFPADDVIFGSGGRAAYALANLDNDIKLVSYIGKDHEDTIRYHATKTWGVNLSGLQVPELVSFSYYHGLSRPIIRPTRLPFKIDKQIEHSNDEVLLFGMLEGNAVIHGNRVVYDPQSPESPIFFEETGSTANELAYVLNRGEAIKLTGKSDPESAAKYLLSLNNVEVVVIKCGAHGALIYTNSDIKSVPAYETSRIWPIGSGDVFAAVFAHFWATKKTEAYGAAEMASKAAALYCNNRNLPISEPDLVETPFKFSPLNPTKDPRDALIYLAGPFFTMSQLWLVEEAYDALKCAGFRVFSPFHDVGIGEAKDVVPLDIKGIEEADVILALCDGLDAGTLFETGYAVKKGIPVVAFGEQTSDESMKMLRGTGCKVFRDFTSAIYHTQWEALK